MNKTVISTMVLLVLLAALTTSASAYCNNGSDAVLVTNPGGTGGGAYPEASTPQSEVWLTPYTGLDRTTLDNYDTFVMWRVCGAHLNTWTAQQKQDIVDWVYAGGKLIIWDTECTDNPDYTWLPYSFVTSNPGAMGARVCPLTVVEENTLSSSDTTSPYYIDTNTICANTDAVGDANILTTYSTSWCKDMTAINVLGAVGPVHVYARYGSGLMIYCGLDADYMGLGYTGSTELEQVLLNELAQSWGNETCGLPCGDPTTSVVLEVNKTGDKTTMNVNETVTFTITVTNNGTAPITGITLQDILPPELSTPGPTTWTIGTLNAGATVTMTLSATAIASGSAQNVAKAMGTDAAGNQVGSDDTFTVTIAANQPPVADAGPDQTIEQSYYQGADVKLNGSGSYDPDGDPLTYSWTWANRSATGVSPTVSLPLGTTTVTLVVNDGTVDSAPDTVVITVQDTTPPEIILSDEQMVLWPPNHKYHTIEIAECCVISVTDICDADVDIDDVVITSVSSDEPENVQGKGDGNTMDDIVIVDSQTVELRAERQGDGNGRVYTINFEVTDDSGNTKTGSCTVWVVHDQGSGDTAVDDGASAGYTVYS